MRAGIKLDAFQHIRESRYRIIRHMADGGEGYLYLAQDTHNANQVCVIKQMFQEAYELDGIEEDYQVFSGLFHPNIVQVFDFFWEDDVFYIVMNYVVGQTLKEYLSTLERPVDELKVLGWGNKLAHILDFLHARPIPIVHSDISPDNVMITKKGDLIVIDFGIARSNFEAIGMREGYSAPEQIEDAIVSPASDVYSLGATLYKALTLVDQPYAGADPREHNPSLSPVIANFIKKCTAEKTSSLFGLIKGRYKNMLEVIDAISECYIGAHQNS